MILLSLLLGGCHASPWATGKPDSPAAKNVADIPRNGPTPDNSRESGGKTTSALAGESTKTAKAPNPTDNPSQNPTANAQSLQEVMAEVRELGVLDPQSQDRLLEDLRKTDPALWPLMVRQVRAAVAYRRRSQDRGQTAIFASTPSYDSPPLPSANYIDNEEIASQSIPLESESRDAVAYNEDRGPGRLPPSASTAKSLPKNRADAPRSREDSPSNALTHDAPRHDGKSVKMAGEDIGNLHPRNETPRSADGDVMPASYVSPGKSANRSQSNTSSEAVAEANNAVDPSADDLSEEASPRNSDWPELMDQTIAAMEAGTPENPKTAEELSRQARLRMLYALAGRREAAAKPIPSAPAAMQDFWAKELYGLTVLLDAERTPDAMARAAEAKQHLSEAYTRLGEMAPLLVRNLSFCTVVQSYGCYKPFKEYEFLPDQEVLLYAELENFGIESTPKGYHTSLRSSYQILDRAGQRVADHAISTTEEYCQNPRRDFFIGYQLRMPSRINPGTYTLQLTIEDMKSQKVGQATVELTIKGSEKDKAQR